VCPATLGTTQCRGKGFSYIMGRGPETDPCCSTFVIMEQSIKGYLHRIVNLVRLRAFGTVSESRVATRLTWDIQGGFAACLWDRRPACCIRINTGISLSSSNALFTRWHTLITTSLFGMACPASGSSYVDHIDRIGRKNRFPIRIQGVAARLTPF
jgi:hypothetical protein